MDVISPDGGRIPGQTDIFEELERQRAWDEVAAAGVIAPLFAGDVAPATAASIFATGFLRSLSDSS